MATVTAFLKHSHIGKKSQAQPYTAAAHARYVMRKNAVQLVYSEGMPKQYHAVQRFLQEHEDGLRKNGRILDKFIISIPHDVSEEDAVKALRLFGHRIGHGKAPFLFALHGFDTRNHHAHFLFIDRDPETGRRVYGTSEKNSTAGIKLEWETAANSTFEQMGYDVRVKVSEGHLEEVANDNDPISTDMQVADSGPEVEETDTETVSLEEDMAAIHGTLDRPDDADISTAANRIRALHTDVTELDALRNARERIVESEQRLEWILSQKESTETDAQKSSDAATDAQQKAEAAAVHLGQYQKSNGKLKGFRLELFGFAIRTGTRQKAEAALTEATGRSQEAARAARVLKSYEVRINQLDREAKLAAEEALMRRNELLGVNGELSDLAETEQTFLKSIQLRIDGNSLQQELELDAKEAWQAWEAGEITDEELRTYCEQSGNRLMLAELDATIEEDGGQSL